MGLRLDNTMQIRSDWGRFAWFERRGENGLSDEPWINTLLVDEMHKLIEDGGMEHMISHFGTDHPDTQYVRNMEIAGRILGSEVGSQIKLDKEFRDINEAVLVKCLAQHVNEQIQSDGIVLTEGDASKTTQSFLDMPNGIVFRLDVLVRSYRSPRPEF